MPRRCSHLFLLAGPGVLIKRVNHLDTECPGCTFRLGCPAREDHSFDGLPVGCGRSGTAHTVCDILSRQRLSCWAGIGGSCCAMPSAVCRRSPCVVRGFPRWARAVHRFAGEYGGEPNEVPPPRVGALMNCKSVQIPCDRYRLRPFSRRTVTLYTGRARTQRYSIGERDLPQ